MASYLLSMKYLSLALSVYSLHFQTAHYCRRIQLHSSSSLRTLASTCGTLFRSLLFPPNTTIATAAIPLHHSSISYSHFYTLSTAADVDVIVEFIGIHHRSPSIVVVGHRTDYYNVVSAAVLVHIVGAAVHIVQLLYLHTSLASHLWNWQGEV